MISSSLVRSLFLTTIISFTTPVLIVGGILLGLSGVTYLPGFEAIAQGSVNQISGFLSVFGSGSAIDGLLTIGFCWGFVGALFELCTFYRYQHLSGH